MAAADRPSRIPALVVGGDSTVADVVRSLRALECIAIGIDACDSAIEMIETIQFGLIVVSVDRSSDWRTCRRIAAVASCPVAVVTDLLAADRRYRKRAFQMGVTAYVRKPCTHKRLREMIRRLTAGEWPIEIVGGVEVRTG